MSNCPKCGNKVFLDGLCWPCRKAEQINADKVCDFEHTIEKAIPGIVFMPDHIQFEEFKSLSKQERDNVYSFLEQMHDNFTAYAQLAHDTLCALDEVQEMENKGTH